MEDFILSSGPLRSAMVPVSMTLDTASRRWIDAVRGTFGLPDQSAGHTETIRHQPDLLLTQCSRDGPLEAGDSRISDLTGLWGAYIDKIETLWVQGSHLMALEAAITKKGGSCTSISIGQCRKAMALILGIRKLT